MRALLFVLTTGILPAVISAQSIEVSIGGGYLNTSGVLAHIRNVRDGVEVDERTRISPGLTVSAEARSSILPWISLSLGSLTTLGSTLDVYRTESSCPPPCNRRAPRPIALSNASLSVVGVSGAFEVPGSFITPGLKIGLNGRRYGIEVDDLPEPFVSAFEESDWRFGWNYGANVRFAFGKWRGTLSLDRYLSAFESARQSGIQVDQTDTNLSIRIGRLIH